MLASLQQVTLNELRLLHQSPLVELPLLQQEQAPILQQESVS